MAGPTRFARGRRLDDTTVSAHFDAGDLASQPSANHPQNESVGPLEGPLINQQGRPSNGCAASEDDQVNTTIRSMTGYASSSVQIDGWTASIDLKSVNHSRLDTRLFIPRECGWLEPAARDIIADHIDRGRVELRVDLKLDAAADTDQVQYIDPDRFSAVSQELRELSNATATGPLTLGDVIDLKDVFLNDAVGHIDADNARLVEAVEAAVEALVDRRCQQGRAIAEDLAGHLDTLRRVVDRLQEVLPRQMDAFRARLDERVTAAVAEFGGGDIDDQRLAQELAYYADKSDVSEELQRIDSHLRTLDDMIAGDDDNGGERGVGKTADFYLQELVRETNTLGSKSRSAKATDLIIEMKSGVERMREQVANIE